MQVKVVKMFRRGVELERRMLNDRSTPTHRGKLVILDTSDQARHRPMKIARIISERATEAELLDVRIVWLNDSRMTLTGEERTRGSDGVMVGYKQSWLISLDAEPSSTP